MPELPEVETLKRQLDKTIVGKTIDRVKVLRAKSFKGDPKDLRGKRIKSVHRIAKIIVLNTFDKQRSTINYLLIHLKLTGQLVYLDKEKRVFGGHPTPDWVQSLPGKHTRV